MYIKALLQPNGRKPAGRRIWSIDLESVWLPFFTSTNAMKDTAIPHDALGAPLRLAYEQDGTVKFGKNGKPVVKVAKPVADNVRLVRENLVAGISAYSHGVATESPEAYKEQVALAQLAGQPIHDKDKLALQALIELATEPATEPATEAPEATETKGKGKVKVAVTS